MRSAALIGVRAPSLVASLGVASFAAVVGCAGTSGRNGPTPPADTEDIGPTTNRQSLAAELEADVLMGYVRDAPLELELATIDPRVGGARIGVGPGDVFVGGKAGVAISRWPLVTDAQAPATAASLNLRVQLARDLSAAWVTDEISWRLSVCGKVAVIPLRLTALYARDGDRWAPVVEHLSYGRGLGSDERAGFGLTIDPAAAADRAPEKLVAGFMSAKRPVELPLSDQATFVPPEGRAPLSGDEILRVPWTSADAKIESARFGYVGADPRRAGVAYWVGTLSVPHGKQVVRTRATFVLERIKGGWALASGHVSLPDDDAALAARFLSNAVTSLNPLRVDCRALL